MTASDDFLVEIGTEELPPKSLLTLSKVFCREIEKELATYELTHGSVAAYATPRRLAVTVAELSLKQQDQSVSRRGPAVAAAFDKEGKPTKAAAGFATSCGVHIGALGRLKTGKGEWLSFNAEVPGKDTATLLAAVVERALSALPIPKPMRWGSGTVEFVRPVHWIVMLLGADVVAASIFGIESDRTTYGHRFHTRDPIVLDSARDYPLVLESSGFVLADFERRRELIACTSQQLADENGGIALIDPKLLDEVTGLVEWPVPVCGSFEQHFLELPREVLIASMQDHQKYFPLESSEGLLTNKFITISNIQSKDPSAVRSGNERVIRPRLSDAKFFWDQDRKSRLDERVDRLDTVIFEKKLGTLKDKTDRVMHLSRALSADFAADSALAVRAAQLSRCDLVTDMVGEFPELQGLMGSYYAAYDKEPPEASQALREFYMPRFAGDQIPASPIGRCIAFADKLDTLVGIFAIGSAPTGDKDPFALRRAALGCVRIALESDSGIDLVTALEHACEGFANVLDTDGVAAAVHKFILDRLRGYFTENGVPVNTVEAVLATDPHSPADIQRRVAAVAAFQVLPESTELASANKRIANILRKNKISQAGPINASLFLEPAEQALAEKIVVVSSMAEEFIVSEDHAAYLKTLSELHAPIGRFFDNVMVMCDDELVRNNRFAILNHVHDLFAQVADISLLND